MIFKLLNAYRRKKVLPLIERDGSSVIDRVSISVRPSPEKGTKYLKVGRDSMVSGEFVFENGKGRASVGDRTYVGGGKFICIDKISIGDDVLISWGCTFMDNNAHPVKFEDRTKDVQDWIKGVKEGQMGKYKDWSKVRSAPIHIGNKAWIGFDCIILKGVTIGEESIVAAGSVVTRDVPPKTVVAGNPAEIVKQLA